MFTLLSGLCPWPILPSLRRLCLMWSSWQLTRGSRTCSSTPSWTQLPSSVCLMLVWGTGFPGFLWRVTGGGRLARCARVLLWVKGMSSSSALQWSISEMNWTWNSSEIFVRWRGSVRRRPSHSMLMVMTGMRILWLILIFHRGDWLWIWCVGTGCHGGRSCFFHVTNNYCRMRIIFHRNLLQKICLIIFQLLV